ncbi:Transmembrane protein [Cavenderia fasciculata]|uniref:Transmembrane protein n=1 Tax=Cavenderia fasciculata TaxID=261658 RepID=F4QER9_CACFS|nr:Transmembrane protein [Cavenderia fasciculata]EGG13330.1 Transmembrane protein [Cavenderia fasciculata]|eukprot:XP_004350034.1 Transmembrane protein [Cavenderia fasciculata]
MNNNFWKANKLAHSNPGEDEDDIGSSSNSSHISYEEDLNQNNNNQNRNIKSPKESRINIEDEDDQYLSDLDSTIDPDKLNNNNNKIDEPIDRFFLTKSAPAPGDLMVPSPIREREEKLKRRPKVLHIKLQHTRGSNFPGSLIKYRHLPDTNIRVHRQHVFRSFKECKDIWMDWQQLSSPTLYKEALVEFVGTMILVFFALSIIITMTNYFNYSVVYNPSNQPAPTVNLVPSFRTPIAVGILHVFMIAILILSTAPASGAHLNPTITLTTLISGYIPRGIVGAGFVKAILPEVIVNQTTLAVCSFGADMNRGHALAAEFMLTFINVYVAFATALDPRQYEVLGPILPSFLIGATLGLTQIIAGGYANYFNGPGYNMARCLGPAVIIGYWHDLWLFLLAQALSSLAVGLLLLVNPPFKTIATHVEDEEPILGENVIEKGACDRKVPDEDSIDPLVNDHDNMGMGSGSTRGKLTPGTPTGFYKRNRSKNRHGDHHHNNHLHNLLHKNKDLSSINNTAQWS